MKTAAKATSWRVAQLSDLVFFQRGFDITKAQQKPGPYPVVSSSGIGSYHDEPKAKGPGVVIGRKGTLGSIHFVQTDYWPHDTTLWSKDFKGNNARFVYYFLHTLDFRRFDVGNSNPTLNRNHIHGLPIRIPPLTVQDQLADVLSAYDDLIENNRRRMKLLEDAARRCIRSGSFVSASPATNEFASKTACRKGGRRSALATSPIVWVVVRPRQRFRRIGKTAQSLGSRPRTLPETSISCCLIQRRKSRRPG